MANIREWLFWELQDLKYRWLGWLEAAGVLKHWYEKPGRPADADGPDYYADDDWIRKNQRTT